MKPSSIIAITGSSSGIGRAMMQLLQQNGITAVGLDLHRPEAPDEHGLHWSVDVTDEDAVERAIASAETAVGPLTGLVNAAGILGKMHRPERLSLAEWEREIRVDLTGTFIACRAVGSRMAARGAGAIVNVASIAGMSSAPTHAYAAAKAGVISLTQSLAQAWGRQGVRVNAVSPGFTRTAALERGIASGALDQHRMADNTALGRLLEPGEIANAIYWLLTSASSGVTGINLPVDGGFLAGITWPAYGR